MAFINYLTKIHLSLGAIEELSHEMAGLGMTQALVVTDKGIRTAGILEYVLNQIAGDAVVFDGTPANPTETAVNDALAVYRDNGCDGLIALGGGSSIDLAKGVGLLASHEGPLEQYALILGGLEKIKPTVAPLIAIPTTAGTGSEVGRGALITLNDGRKLGFIAPPMIPDVAICDPALTVGLPPLLTAATGMDALTHCIETYLSPRDNPTADAIALDGAGRARNWIERATQIGGDLEARRQMMVASLHGGLTFQKGLGAVHAMSHPLGGLKSPALHHGTLNAVILPAVLRFNRDHVGDKLERLTERLGMAEGADLAQEIEGLNRRLGLPANLREMGVEATVLPAMIKGAVADHSSATNPRPADAEDYASLFDEAMG